MTRFVVDASIAIAWVHPDQATAVTQAMLASVATGAILEVPSLWHLEVANALLVLRRRGKITDREWKLALDRLGALPCAIDGDTAAVAFGSVSEVATRYDLSVYDAAYVELAQRKALPLASKDQPLLKAARRAKVTVWSA
jgi:predicted nucleic acid-binding protein